MILFYGVIWSLWRRILGGWGSHHRSIIFFTMFIMLTPFIYKGLEVFIVVEVLSALFWSLGHDYNRWWIVLRYPLVGASYAYFEKFWGNKTALGTFIDGYSCLAELLIGFVYGILIGSLLI